MSLRQSCKRLVLFFFFFNDTATTEIYTLSLHDALPIYYFQYVATNIEGLGVLHQGFFEERAKEELGHAKEVSERLRSEEHTSELQSRQYLVCRLLLEKKKQKLTTCIYTRKKSYDR